MKKISLILTLAILSFSCNNQSDTIETTLKEAGENRNELEKVLDFYSEKPEDSLKYKAAHFLIEHMNLHSFYKPLPGFDSFFDSVAKLPNKRDVFNEKTKKDLLNEEIARQESSNIYLRPKLTKDCKYFTANFLIENIDLSYAAWNSIPADKRASFEDYLNYIVPYRSGNHFVEKGDRKALAQKYGWVITELKKGKPLPLVVDSVKSHIKLELVPECRKLYPQPLSINQIAKTRMVICEDGANYLVFVFRALGLVSAIDQINIWGNNTKGHAWIYVKYGKEEYSTDIITTKDKIKEEYRNESIPKVMREMYFTQNNKSLFPNLLDVTEQYVQTATIKVPNIFEIKDGQPVLCVFGKENGWIPVYRGTTQNTDVTYNNIGRNVVFLPTSLYHELEPINYPFYIDSNNKLHYLQPQTSKKINAILTRKCALSSPRFRRKINWIKNINGATIQGSNTADFKNAKTLYTIKNLKSTQPQQIKLSTKEKYKFIRLNAMDKSVFISKLMFMDSFGTALNGEMFMYSMSDNSEKNIFVNRDPSKFVGGNHGFQVGLAFENPTAIGSVRFQVRNDGNHVNIGNQYELFYWDRQWKTLGTQIAQDTVLHYKTPANALLWLKNLTEGNEEHVFIINKNHRQYWIGSDN